jgi:LysM repeat protein
VGNRVTSFIGLLLLFLVLIAVTAFARPVLGAQLYTEECGLTHAARIGDNLITIAQRCGVSEGELAAANPHIDPFNIQAGQVLIIPLPPRQPQQPADPSPGFIFPSNPLQISPQSGPVGTLITISGSGYQPNQTLHVGPAMLDQQPVQLYEVRTNQQGFMQVVLPLPPQAQTGQSWLIVARDPQTGTVSTSGIFTVTAPSSPVPVPPTGPMLPPPTLPDPILSPIPATGGQTGALFHTVVGGETLFRIAQRYGTTVSAILQVNPQITNPNLIFPGQTIRIPVAAPIPPTGPGVPAFPIPPTGPGTYIIQLGDTLAGIAARYGTSVQALMLLNPQIVNPNILEAGRVIRIN